MENARADKSDRGGILEHPVRYFWLPSHTFSIVASGDPHLAIQASVSLASPERHSVMLELFLVVLDLLTVLPTTEGIGATVDPLG